MTDSPFVGKTLGPLARHLRGADFVDFVKTGLVLHDLDGAGVDLNPAAASMLGVGVTGLAGAGSIKARWAPIHLDGSPMEADEFPVSSTLRTGVECRDVVLGFHVPGRSRLWLSMDTYRLTNLGNLIGVVSAFDDITDLIEATLVRETMIGVMKVVVNATDEAKAFQTFCESMLDNARVGLVAIGFKGAMDSGALIDFPYVAGPGDALRKASITWSGATALGRGPVGTAMRTRVTQTCHDVLSDPRLEPWWNLANETGMNSCVVIPFKARDRDAIVVVYTQHAYTFNDVIVEGFEAIVEELEFVLVHVKSVDDLHRALKATIAALSSVAEVRDPYTAGHQLNVGELGFAIAEALELEPELAELVRKSGQLLDVGKIAVPLELLVRPGSLSAIEFDIVKEHTTLGEKILSDALLPWPIAEVAVQHHERLDGSGYPAGLANGQISLPSRIIAVADVVDAMTHHRPYRAAHSIGEALSFLGQHAGTLFDEDVVRACRGVFEAGFTFKVYSGG